MQNLPNIQIHPSPLNPSLSGGVCHGWWFERFFRFTPPRYFLLFVVSHFNGVLKVCVGGCSFNRRRRRHGGLRFGSVS
ncbi:hypothetical protein P8452_29358 [Trifolium repens]|nr:hypothetical protein P8452_29358 [Trifolium repens]